MVDLVGITGGKISRNIDVPKGHVFFQPSIFRCYVSFRKGTHTKQFSWSILFVIPTVNEPNRKIGDISFRLNTCKSYRRIAETCLKRQHHPHPIGCMYGMCSYIWLILMGTGMSMVLSK